MIRCWKCQRIVLIHDEMGLREDFSGTTGTKEVSTVAGCGCGARYQIVLSRLPDATRKSKEQMDEYEVEAAAMWKGV